MEQVKDTPFEHGVIYWPIRPPRTSMLVVVKATVALEDGSAQLAEKQEPTTGALHWDDDPTRSYRHPSDFALLKPRGECFVVGSCRTLTERPVDQTVLGFRIGDLQRSLRVYGDRTWVGGSPSRPVPFTEMPLAWERSFGGPGNATNPVGRGLADDANGVAWLPNLEDANRPIAARGDRPPPACTAPLGMTWPARTRYVGTYDAKWQKTRSPWLAEDFQFAFFNEAPPEQQIEGYWRGDERIELKHLHPRVPAVRAKLPGVRARAFVERGDAFDEVPLVLDTVTIDADRGLAFLVWRGTVELSHDRLAPDGIDRLFLMHEPLGMASSVSACRQRMGARIAADQAELESMAGTAPPAAQEPGVDDTIDDAVGDLAAVRAAAEQIRAAEAPQEDAGAAALEKLKHDLTNAGIDVEKILAEAEGQELAMPEPADTEKLIEQLQNGPVPVPPELIEQLRNPEPEPEDPYEPPQPEEPPDLRALVVALHRQKRPIRGDFTGANLAGLDLPGLDASDAILLDANFRGANLTGARLDGATLVRADFLSAVLSKVSARDADLTEAVLEDAKLEGANLAGATMIRAELQQAKLDGARLDKADLTSADLEGASLREASCNATVFNQASLAGATFERANLTSARFYGVRATQISLDRAELAGLRVGRGADLSGSSARGAKAHESHWRDSTLEGVRFDGTMLMGADFSQSRMAGAVFVGCVLRRARFIEGQLEGARLDGADMYEATFREADLTGATFRNASLFRADFYRARGDRVDLSGANVDGTMWDGR